MRGARPRLVRERLRSRVIVTLKSGESFAGVLYAADELAWVLRQAEVLGAGDKRTNVVVDGELLVLAADIAFAQVL